MALMWSVVVLLLAVVGPSRAAGPEHALGLVAPVDVAFIDKCADGGSTKGRLVDAQGTEYHFFIRVVINGTGPCPWYVGAEYDTGQAERLPEVEPRKDAIKAVLSDWLDRTYTTEEQALILVNPRIDPRPEFKAPPRPRMHKISEPDSSVLADTTKTVAERMCEFNSHFAMEWGPYVQPDVDKAYRILRFLGRDRVSSE